MPADAIIPKTPAPVGSIYASVPGIAATTGVALNAPPVGPIMAAASKAIADATAQIPPGRTGALVAIGNEAGINLAVVQRIGGDFAVTAWIGRSWKGSLEYGAAAKLTW